MTINYTIASYTATILGIPQSEVSSNSNTIRTSYVIPSDLEVEEYATFSITVIDNDGLPNTITQDSVTLPTNKVFVDTISPTVTLPESYTINVNDPLPTIEAEIKDMDPNYNYSGKFTIPESTILASVDNTTAEVYPFTYAAPDDNAGNPGQSVTINVIVQENGITILNSSIVDNTTQSFSNSERIIAKIHDTNVNASNTLELSSPTLELDVSDITVTTSGTTTHTTTYQHPLDLIVHNTISAQIESGTALIFTAAASINEDNFIVQYITDDGHNDDAIQLGLENVKYTLNNDAIPITFERVSSSPTVFIRENQ